MKKGWLSISTMLLAVTALWARGEGDIVSPSGDSLRLRPIVSLVSNGVLQRDLYNDKTRARELFEQSLLLDSMDVVANYQMSLLLCDDAPKDALIYSRRASEGDSTNKWSMEQYARNLVMVGDYKSAEPLYVKLIDKEPNNADFYRILALLYQYTERPHSAIMTLDSAALRIGAHPYLSRIKHSLLLTTKQEARAVEEALEMVANMPYDISSRLLLAEAYLATGEDFLAEGEYNIAKQIDSTSADLLMAMCSFYEQRGRVRDYIETLKQLFESDEYELTESLSLLNRMMSDKSFYRANYVGITELISTLVLRYPSNLEVINLRASHLIAFGMLDEALDIYKTLTRETPAVVEHFHSVIDIEIYKKRQDSVALYVNRAIELFPDDIELYITKAGAKALEKDFEGAIDVYREALKRDVSDTLASQIWGYIGDVEYQIADNSSKESTAKKAMKRCYAAYNKALDIYADNVLILNNYAYFISETPGGDFERALKMSTRAIEIVKNSPIYLDTHAWVLYRLGRYEEAAKYMRTAISLDKSKSAELYLHYGDILFAQGNNFMAEVYWKRAEAQGYSKEKIQQRIDLLKDSAQ